MPTITACRSRPSPTSPSTATLRELFHSDPVIEAAELLLQEKAPRDIPVMSAKHESDTPASIQDDLLRPELRKIYDPASRDRELVFLSNGHYLADADRNRRRLFQLERPVGLPLEGRSDRGSLG